MRSTICGYVVAFTLAVASACACAESGTIYKCQQANGRVIYSGVPCDANDAKGIKRLEADSAGKHLRESNYHSAISMPEPQARREEPKRDAATDLQAAQPAQATRGVALPEKQAVDFDQAETDELGSRLIDKSATFLLGSALTFLLSIWMVVRIWKSSPGFAVASFFFLPAAFVPLFRNWGDDHTDIRLPFFLTLASVGFTYYNLYKMLQVVQHAQQSALQAIGLLV